MKGIQLFVQELQRRGVPFVATLCGNGLNPFDDACREAGLRLVDVRNEQAAGYIAEVTGRLTRQVGVCAVSSGVAHANGMTGVVDAWFDGAPMLMVSGCGDTDTAGQGHFQDLDQVALAGPVTKYAQVVDRPERIPLYVHEAFAAALAGRPGPVHLTLPLNVQTATVDPRDVVRPLADSEAMAASGPGDPTAVATLADLLRRSARPLLVAGSGAYYAHAENAVKRFVQTLHVPVVVPIWDRGVIPEPLDEFVGVIGAATGGPPLLEEADLILVAGAACDYRLGYLRPPAIREDAQVVRIDVDPLQSGRGSGAHFSIMGDPGCVLAQVTDVLSGEAIEHTDWLHDAQSRRAAYRAGALRARSAAAPGTHASDVVAAIRDVLTDDTVIIVDGGNIGQWCHQLLCDRYPGHWVTCGASGAIGFGVPAAMAARLVYPDRPIILLSGDGSFTFSAVELESATRQGLSFVVIVADDQAWGITHTGQMRQFGRSTTAELGPIRFDLLGQSLGARGVRVDRSEDIVPALLEGLSADRPTLIHVPVVRSNPVDR